MQASHPARAHFGGTPDDIYVWARVRDIKVETIDDYLALIDRCFEEAIKAGAIAMKSAHAWDRTIKYEKVTKEQATVAFGKLADYRPNRRPR